MSYDAPDGHIQFEGDSVSRLPNALEDREAFLQIQLCRLAVQRESDGRSQAVVVTIQVARERLVASPTGNAQMQSEPLWFCRFNGDLDLSIRGITGGLFHPDRSPSDREVGRAADEEVDKEVCVPGGIDEAR